MSQSDYNWGGRTDTEDGQDGLRWHQVIAKNPHHSDPALLGFPCDLGVANNKGRTGASAGPNALRDALANCAWHKDGQLFDAGNIDVDNDLPASQQRYASALADLLKQHKLVVGLGGGHEIGWASYLGLATAYPHKRIGIINIDAHFDLRKPAPLSSSGTPFWQVAKHCEQQGKPFHYACLGVSESANTRALFKVADSYNCPYLLDYQCSIEAAKDKLAPMLADIELLYLTICLDAFPAAMAPGVSAPSALGVQPHFAIELLQFLSNARSQYHFEWPLIDIAELNPRFDIDNRTAKLGARLVFEGVNCVL